MTVRIIVGAEGMFVERHGIRSVTASLGDQHGPDEVRVIAASLWATIRQQVSFLVWLRHRLRMAAQRRQAGRVSAGWPGPYYPGPQPYHVAQRPWRDACYGEWTILPSGVVARLLAATNRAEARS